MHEQVTMAIYDVVSARCRRRMVKVCHNYGLKRFQYSAFVGKLDARRRQAMFNELVKIIRDSRLSGRVIVVPLCQGDYEAMLNFEVRGEEADDDDDEEDPGLC